MKILICSFLISRIMCEEFMEEDHQKQISLKNSDKGTFVDLLIIYLRCLALFHHILLFSL